MKLTKLASIILIVSLNCRGDNFRLFHDVTGREIEACVRSYNPRTNMVKVELRNKALKSVKTTVFSEEDQAYILDWFKADALLSGKTLRLSANKKTVRNGSYHEEQNGWHSVYPGMEFKDMNYEIILENRSGQILENVEVEYCVYHKSIIDEIFMTTELRDNGYYPVDTEQLPRKVDINIISGKWEISSLETKKQEYATKEIRLKNGSEFKSDHNKSTRNTRSVSDELLGIRIRVYIALESGKKVMKEFSYPDTLIDSTKWKSPEKN